MQLLPQGTTAPGDDAQPPPPPPSSSGFAASTHWKTWTCW